MLATNLSTAPEYSAGPAFRQGVDPTYFGALEHAAPFWLDEANHTSLLLLPVPWPVQRSRAAADLRADLSSSQELGRCLAELRVKSSSAARTMPDQSREGGNDSACEERSNLLDVRGPHSRPT